jgi:hypothetical protein
MDSAGRHSPPSVALKYFFDIVSVVKWKCDTGLGQAIDRGSPNPVIEMRSLMARERITAQPR